MAGAGAGARWALLALLAACGAAALAPESAEVDSGVVVESAERTLELGSQLVKLQERLAVRGAASFLLAARARPAHLAVQDAAGRELRVREAAVRGREGELFWRVEGREAGAGVQRYTVEWVYADALAPHPAEITQQEPQLVRYEGDLYLYSPYRVLSQKTVVKLNTKNAESYTKVKPYTPSDSGITYGPYQNVAPFTTKELSIHYKNNSPFLSVARIERLIEVSHWGNIAIEENIEVYHSGAKLKGPFSRYDYQQDHHSGPSSVRSYRTLLPASASDVYYRDTNGNISTSNMKVKKDSVELELRPRYPLFGGWKSHYTLGYNVPSYEYLFYSGNEYLLKMRAIDHIFDDMKVEELVTKIILPEGSTNIKLTAPYAVNRLPDSLHYTYLDTTGRPVITFTKKNLVENHIQDFQLRYSFPRILMLQEPLLVVGFLFALFLCVIIYVRLDFSIHKDEHHKE